MPPTGRTQYSIESSGPVIRTSSPVSSRDLAEGRLLGRLAAGRACPWAASRSRRRARAGGCRRRAGAVRPRTGRRCRRRRWRSRSSGAPRRRGGAGTTARPGAPGAGPVHRDRGPRPAARGCDGGPAGGSRASRRAGARQRADVRAAQHGRRAGRRPERRRPGRGRAAARGPGSTGGRIGPPAGPRTWRRCCAPWAAMVPRSGRPCKCASAARMSARLRCQRATGLGEVDLALAQRASTAAGRRARAARSAARWRRASRRRRGSIGPVSAAADPERPGVAQRALDERAVDRQRAGLVEAGDAAELGDRVEQRDEARRPRGPPPRGRPPSSPAPGGPAGAPIASAMSASMRGQLVVALDRDRRAVERGDRPLRVGERDQRVERARPGCPAAIAGARTSAPSAPLVWTIAWPRTCRSAAGERRDGVVGDGEDDRARPRRGGPAARRTPRAPVDQRAEPLAPAGVAAGDRAGPASRPGSGRRRAPSRPRRRRRSR